MKKTEEEMMKIAVDELDKRYGKGAEYKTMNKIWVAGFLVGYEIGLNEAAAAAAPPAEGEAPPAGGAHK